MVDFSGFSQFLSEKKDFSFFNPDSLDKYVESLPTEIASVKTIGYSINNKPIYSIIIGRGSKDVVVAAGAHADEPTGTVTAVSMIQFLLSEETDGIRDEFRFHFIPQLNPDGVERNWNWMKYPFSYKNYVRYNVRESSVLDIEHGIPTGNDSLVRPEALSFAEYLRSLDPLYMYFSLHSTYLLGGIFFYFLNRNGTINSPVLAYLKEVCHEVAIPIMNFDLGQKQPHTGFHLLPPSDDSPRINTCQFVTSFCNCTHAMVSETPFIVDTMFNNNEETDEKLSEIERQSIDNNENLLNGWENVLRELQDFPSTEEAQNYCQYYESHVRNKQNTLNSRRKWLETMNGGNAPQYRVYIAELDRLSTEYLIGLAGLQRLSGLPLRLVEQPLDKYKRLFNSGWAQYEEKLSYRIIPMKNQIRLQAEMVFSCLKYGM